MSLRLAASLAMLAGWALLAPARAFAQPPAPAAPAEAGAPGDIPWADIPTFDPDAPFVAYDDAWPTRAGCEGRRLQGVIVEVAGRRYRPEGERAFGLGRVAGADADPDAAALVAGLGLPAGSKFRFEGAGSFVLDAPPIPDGVEVGRGRMLRAGLAFKFVSARPGADAELLVDRTWFALFEPPGSSPPIAAVLLTPGMFGTPEGTLDALTLALRRRGFVVLRMVAQPARFVERARVELDPNDPARSAARLAAIFDDRQAECAFAAEAAVDHVLRARPALRDLPWAGVGFSGGAITMPTIAARLDGMLRAAVLVGGGCDFWTMSQSSNYRTWMSVLEVRPDVPLATQPGKRLHAEMLRASRLDPYQTAAALRGVPTLSIIGTRDLAVPTPLGRALNARLDDPKVWELEGGHEELFMQLPSRFGPLINWLTEALGKPVPGAPPRPASPAILAPVGGPP